MYMTASLTSVLMPTVGGYMYIVHVRCTCMLYILYMYVLFPGQAVSGTTGTFGTTGVSNVHSFTYVRVYG